MNKRKCDYFLPGPPMHQSNAKVSKDGIRNCKAKTEYYEDSLSLATDPSDWWTCPC